GLDDRVVRDDRTTLCDLNALVDVDAGGLAAEDVFRRPHAHVRGQQTDQNGDCGTGGHGGRLLEAEPPAGGRREQGRSNEGDQPQTVETVAADGRETEHDDGGPDAAEDEGPVDALL